MVSGHNMGVTDDLIALACFYCEPGRRLIIPLNVLRTLLPLSEILSRRLITQRAINAANRAQSKWRFRLNRDSIGIQSAEKYVQWEDPLVLNAYARRTPNGHKKSGTVFDADPQFYGYDERP